MKKILSIVAITIMVVALFSCAGSSENRPEVKHLNAQEDVYTIFSPRRDSFVEVREIRIGGHSYIVATSMQLIGTRRPGGVSIIHSAGCSCIRK